MFGCQRDGQRDVFCSYAQRGEGALESVTEGTKRYLRNLAYFVLTVSEVGPS